MTKEVFLFLKLFSFIIIFSILMLLVGMFIGGNFFTDFELFARRGYEALGKLGLILGFIISSVISIVYYLKVHTIKE